MPIQEAKQVVLGPFRSLAASLNGEGKKTTSWGKTEVEINDFMLGDYELRPIRTQTTMGRQVVTFSFFVTVLNWNTIYNPSVLFALLPLYFSRITRHHMIALSTPTLAYTGLTGIVLYFIYYWKTSYIPRGMFMISHLNKLTISPGLRLPPGPPGRCLIGNLLDFPRSKEWLTLKEWAKDYGSPSLFYVIQIIFSLLCRRFGPYKHFWHVHAFCEFA